LLIEFFISTPIVIIPIAETLITPPIETATVAKAATFVPKTINQTLPETHIPRG
jgi:hypothetical protein